MEEQNVRFYEIKKTISEEDFIRTIIVGLGTSKETPADVFDGEFGEVNCERQHFVSVGGTAKVYTNASIGYDHEEKELKYNNITNKLEESYETVTDWRPYQSTYFDENAVGFSENVENPSFADSSAFRDMLSRVKGDEVISIDEVSDEILKKKGFGEIKDEAVKFSIEDMKASAIQKSEESLPGDRYRDFSASSEIDAEYSENYIVSCHNMTYTYSGEPYHLKAYANGECVVRGSIPKTGKNEKKNALGGITKAVSLVLSVLLMICVMSFMLSPVIVSIVAALATIAFAFHKWVDISYRKGANRKSVNKKKNAVIKILLAKGLAPLSQDELNEFNYNYKTGHKHKMTVGEAFPLVFYIISFGLFLLNYKQISLVNILMIAMFVGIPALIIYGLVIAPKKKK